MEKIIIVFLSLIIRLAFITILAYPLMLLINAVFAPGLLMSVFGVTQIGFGHAVGLSLVVDLLGPGKN